MNDQRSLSFIKVAKFSFSNGVVNKWSILDEEIISIPVYSLAEFKRKLGMRGLHKLLAFFP